MDLHYHAEYDGTSASHNTGDEQFCVFCFLSVTLLSLC